MINKNQHYITSFSSMLEIDFFITTSANNICYRLTCQLAKANENVILILNYDDSIMYRDRLIYFLRF